MKIWRYIRWGLTGLASLLLLPILTLNIEKLAERQGWDQILSSWWPSILSELSSLGDSNGIRLLAVGASCLAAGMWANHFVSRTFSYVMHEERLSRKQLIKERELELQKAKTIENANRKPTQAALDGLAELRNQGIDTVYAVRISTEQDFQNWKHTKKDWENQIRGFIEQNFPRADFFMPHT